MKNYIKRKIYNFSPIKIQGRTSCFGTRVSKTINKFYYFNNQKYRIDNFLESFKRGKSCLSCQKELKIFFKEDSLFDIIQKQKDLNILNRNLVRPDIILIESYSDLTDMLFKHISGSIFLCHITDFNPSVWKLITEENVFGNKQFINQGLLNIDNFDLLLENFITELNKIYKINVPIVYLHTPTKFEKRKKILNRNKAFLEITKKVANNNKSFFSVEIPESEVFKLSENSLTYHFSDRTVNYAASSIKKIIYEFN